MRDSSHASMRSLLVFVFPFFPVIHNRQTSYSRHSKTQKRKMHLMFFKPVLEIFGILKVERWFLNRCMVLAKS